MSRVILHVDANSFYASVEVLYHPGLRGLPVSVCGDPGERHGIVLTSTIPAKKRGVKTGMAIWQARQVCPDLVVLPPDYPLYVHFSELMRGILQQYSERVEPFGLDESWVDLTGPGLTLEAGEKIAHEIRVRIHEEVGITVSVGVSWNKVLAKLGSDMKKPDAVTLIRPQDLPGKVWPLPASDLLYVGPGTARPLASVGIHTIGDLAAAPDEVLLRRFGKNGLMIKAFALGQDTTPVAPSGLESAIKSIGNSNTAPHDLVTFSDARCMIYLLSESVGARLRSHGFTAGVVSVSARSTDLSWASHQRVLKSPTASTSEIAKAACELFHERFLTMLPCRSVGVHCSDLQPDTQPVQLDLTGEQAHRDRLLHLDRALDGLRNRFGNLSVQRGVVLADSAFAAMDPKANNTIHPVGFLRS